MIDDDSTPIDERRKRRIRVITWVAIIAVFITSGGATVLLLLFG